MSDDQLKSRDAQWAAEWDADVTVERIAETYAEAFLDAAARIGDLPALVEELQSLVTDVLDVFPGFEQVLASAIIQHEEKVEIIERALGGQASPVVMNFLKVLSRRGRLDCLRAIARKVGEGFDRRRNLVPVWVTTATPLSDELVRKLSDRVKQLIDGEPKLEVKVDPAVIGGISVRIGDKVYDASVAAQLEAIRKQIIDRSAHEIQSRRDRFRHPTGD